MSDKAEAAQKWAEAKVALDAADAALGAAKEAYAKAEDAEFHAWQALEELSGRVSATPIADESSGSLLAYGQSVLQAQGQQQPSAFRHSLPQNPVG